MLRRFICCLMCCGSPIALADVQETLRFKYYEVDVANGQTLLQALDRATPIRRHWRRFHGFAAWELRWRLTWQPLPDGRCAMTEVHTHLNMEITLPSVREGNAETKLQFERYINALREHELGHHRIAQSVAERVDQALQSMPAMESCETLEQSAHALGHRLVDQAREEETAYDRETQFGRTQGAWLPR